MVLDHAGSATYADNVEVLIGEGASPTLVSVQDWDDDTVHLSHHRYLIGRDARLKSVVVTLGGDLVRLYPQVSYTGPGGDAQLLGLYFSDAGSTSSIGCSSITPFRTAAAAASPTRERCRVRRRAQSGSVTSSSGMPRLAPTPTSSTAT